MTKIIQYNKFFVFFIYIPIVKININCYIRTFFISKTLTIFICQMNLSILACNWSIFINIKFLLDKKFFVLVVLNILQTLVWAYWKCFIGNDVINKYFRQQIAHKKLLSMLYNSFWLFFKCIKLKFLYKIILLSFRKTKIISNFYLLHVHFINVVSKILQTDFIP